MKKLFIVKTGTTFFSTLDRYGDFDTWVREGLGQVGPPLSVVDVVRGETLPAAGECCGVVVTGSHAMVTDNLPWSVTIEKWIPSLIESCVPFLGICYGHQLLGRAMGGEVGYHPLGEEIGTVAVELTAEGFADPLFSGVSASFNAHTTHAQSVLSLPPGSKRLAWNSHDPNHAFRVGGCAWGVQFHPEYRAAVMKAYIEAQSLELSVSGRNPAMLLRDVQDTPQAGLTLLNFTRIVADSV